MPVTTLAEVEAAARCLADGRPGTCAGTLSQDGMMLLAGGAPIDTVSASARGFRCLRRR